MKFETNRTYIREFCLTDAAAVYDFNSDPFVTRYTGDAGLVKKIEDAEHIIQNIWLKEYRKYGYGRWAVVDKKTNKVIGFAGFKFIPDMGMPDIGYRLLPSYWGKGFATEITQASAEYFGNELGNTMYFGDAMEGNYASIKILTKLGLKFGGYVKDGEHLFLRFIQTTPSLLNPNQFYK